MVWRCFCNWTQNGSQPLCSCDFWSNVITIFVKWDSKKHTSNYNFDSDFVTKTVDSFFVDDFTGGEDTVEKAHLFKKLKLRFLEGRFNQRKWRTNDKKLRELICDNDTSIKPSKVLGVQWNEQHGVFICDLKGIFDQSRGLSPTKKIFWKHWHHFLTL